MLKKLFLEKKKILFKISILIFLVILNICGGLYLVKINKDNNKNENLASITEVNIPEENNNKVEKKKIKVDLKGEVNKPGVYEVEEDTTINELINVASGPTSKDNLDNINLSTILEDEMLVVIPSKTSKTITNKNTNQTSTQVTNEETSKETSKSSTSKKYSSSKSSVSVEVSTPTSKVENNNTSKETDITPENKIININTASQSELETLNGIGSAKALAIIKYREEFGNFLATEDIKKVKGIGDALYAKIKDFITV